MTPPSARSPAGRPPREGVPARLITAARANQAGLTLLELVLVAGLVFVLAAIAVPAARDHVDRARRAKAIAHIHDLQAKLLQFHEDADQYPDSLAAISWTERDP
ncbi:MAG: hypothetical protein AB1451_13590 [Nitrospirota bacterium]